jgi:glycosyltransferase involved in cell wall biosynthesis
MAAGKPILGAMGGSGKELIGESQCGQCVEAEDHAGLASQMMAYIENPEAFDAMAANGRRYFRENFTADIFIDKLTQLLEQTKRA